MSYWQYETPDDTGLIPASLDDITALFRRRTAQEQVFAGSVDANGTIGITVTAPPGKGVTPQQAREIAKRINHLADEAEKVKSVRNVPACSDDAADRRSDRPIP